MLFAMAQKPTDSTADLKPDERGRWRIRPDWISQVILINVGLIVLGVYVVSALITTGVSDTASRVAIVSWSASMPILGFLSLTTELQRGRTYASFPWYFMLAQAVGQGGAVVGFGAALWHVWFVAGVVFTVFSVASLFLYQAYFRRLVKDNQPEHLSERPRPRLPTRSRRS
jgi:hypothetical protein